MTNRQAYGNDNYPKVDGVENDLHWEGDPNLPPIGTRVRRGQIWPFTNQDSGMPGTVIGYRDDRKYSMIIYIIIYIFISDIYTVIMLLNGTYTKFNFLIDNTF